MIYFAWTNVLDDIVPTIDNSSTDPSLIPAINLTDQILHRPWRTTSNVITRVEFDLTGVTEDIDVVAMMGMRLAGLGDIIKNTSYNPASPGAAVEEYRLDTSVVSPYGLLAFERAVGWLPDSGTTGAYITVEADANTSDYIDIGRAWAGPIWLLDHGQVIVTYKDTGQSNRAFRLYGWPVEKTEYKEVSIIIPLVTGDDIWNGTAMTFFEAAKGLRKGAEVLVALFPDGTATVKDGYLSQQYFFYGTVLNQVEWRSKAGDFMGMQFNLQELF